MNSKDNATTGITWPIDYLLFGIFNSSIAKYLQKLGRTSSHVVAFLIIALLCMLCVFIRLFAVVRYESVIHEFDPHFNFRTSKYLDREGFYEFWNWFDNGSWYPLGRVIGQTLFPGLMTTASLMRSIAHKVGILISIREICVFTGPIVSALTAIASYWLTFQASGRKEAGLLAALFSGICPSYLSRSVAGSYDNEAVAIFALVFSFACYLKAINDGRMLSSLLAAFAYLYMVTSWGAYVFVTNTIAIHIFALFLLGRFTLKHYIVYTVFYVMGTILCLNIPFVNFGAVKSAEHLSSHCVFFLVTLVVIVNYLKYLISSDSFKRLLNSIIYISIFSLFVCFLALTIMGKARWAGRSMTLLDPTYASKYVPIIASVSEHQATTWSQYIFDLHFVSIMFPLGIISCALCVYRSQKLSPINGPLLSCYTAYLPDGCLFLLIYGILAVYFSGVMIRLMLVLAPAACCLAGVGLSYVISTLMYYIRSPAPIEKCHFESENKNKGYIPRFLACFLCFVLFLFCMKFVVHCVWSSAFAYSHPSVILSSKLNDGTRLIQDDYREAYYWFRKNTPEDARIMSWWDYGYQCTELGNRTTLVDNNTWNTTHIATVGKAFASTEEDAYPIMEKLDVDYVFVVFGGFARYSSDDINKFLWMVRIASNVYPVIQQSDYLSPNGHYTVGREASPAMLNSLIYKLSYYRFSEVQRGGYDLARNYPIGRTKFNLQHFEEVYTTDNYIVRIYKVKKPFNRRHLFSKK